MIYPFKSDTITTTSFSNISNDSTRPHRLNGRMSNAQESSKVLDNLRSKGKAWYLATELQSDLIVEVEGVIFHLHKFPLLSRSGRLNKLVFESRDTEKDRIRLVGLPGGPEAFELAAKFCYASPIRVEITPSNVAALRCAAEYLEMTEDLEEGNLISKTEAFLSYVVLASWWDSITVLQSCAALSPWAEDLNIVHRCIESIAWKASTDPSCVRWPFTAKDGTCPPNWNAQSSSPAKFGDGQEEGELDAKRAQAESLRVEVLKLRSDFGSLLSFCSSLQQQLEKVSRKKNVLWWVNSGSKKRNRVPKAENEGSLEPDVNAALCTPHHHNSQPLAVKWRRNSI